MKGAPAPLGGDGLAVMTNTVEHERAGRWQDRQKGPVLGSLLSWGGAGGECSWMGWIIPWKGSSVMCSITVIPAWLSLLSAGPAGLWQDSTGKRGVSKQHKVQGNVSLSVAPPHGGCVVPFAALSKGVRLET